MFLARLIAILWAIAALLFVRAVTASAHARPTQRCALYKFGERVDSTHFQLSCANPVPDTLIIVVVSHAP